MANFHQEQQPITAYYSKLKELWNELASLKPTSSCTCGASKSLAELHETDRIYQFLMGLNDSFEQLRSQIVATDPLSSIGRYYAILHQEETQRLIQLSPPRPYVSALIASSTLPKTSSRPRREWPVGTYFVRRVVNLVTNGTNVLKLLDTRIGGLLRSNTARQVLHLQLFIRFLPPTHHQS